MAMCGTYQPGYVMACPKCRFENFYVLDLPSGAVATGVGTAACHKCGEAIPRDATRRAHRFACPDCGEPNVDDLKYADPTAPRLADDVAECCRCGAGFYKFVTVHGEGQPGWWLGHYLSTTKPPKQKPK